MLKYWALLYLIKWVFWRSLDFKSIWNVTKLKKNLHLARQQLLQLLIAKTYWKREYRIADLELFISLKNFHKTTGLSKNSTVQSSNKVLKILDSEVKKAESEDSFIFEFPSSVLSQKCSFFKKGNKFWTLRIRKLKKKKKKSNAKIFFRVRRYK